VALIGLARGGLLHRHCIEGNPNFEQLDDFANAEIDEEGARAVWLLHVLFLQVMETR